MKRILFSLILLSSPLLASEGPDRDGIDVADGNGPCIDTDSGNLYAGNTDDAPTEVSSAPDTASSSDSSSGGGDCEIL